MLKQVGQLLIGATEVIHAHADHQANGHMAALVAGLEDQLQAVRQLIALYAEAVEGKTLSCSQQHADKQQATHKNPWISESVLRGRVAQRVSLCRLDAAYRLTTRSRATFRANVGCRRCLQVPARRYRCFPALRRRCRKTVNSGAACRRSAPGARSWFRCFG